MRMHLPVVSTAVAIATIDRADYTQFAGEGEKAAPKIFIPRNEAMVEVLVGSQS